MGNTVQAATALTEPTAIGEDKISEKKLECPGSAENVHSKSHEVFPIPFDGAKLMISKGLSPNFQVSHILNLGGEEQSSYRFGATYVGHNKVSDTESYPVLMGEIQANGNLQAQIIHRFSPMLSLRYIHQTAEKMQTAQQFVAELRGKSWQSTTTLVNPDILTGEVVLGLDFMRQVTPRTAFGSTFFLQRTPQLPEGVWGLVGKYTADRWQLSTTFRPLQLSVHTSMHLQVNENLQFAAELESSHQRQSCTTTLGYKYEMQKAGVAFKTQVDSNWNIASSLEKKLNPFPFTFSLSATGNQAKSKYSFGVGLTVG